MYKIRKNSVAKGIVEKERVVAESMNIINDFLLPLKRHLKHSKIEAVPNTVCGLCRETISQKSLLGQSPAGPFHAQRYQCIQSKHSNLPHFTYMKINVFAHKNQTIDVTVI